MAESGSSTGWWILTIVVVGLLIAGNPSRDAHKAEVYAHMQRQARKEGFWASLGASAAESADALELAGVEYQDFLVGSALIHDGEFITVGVLGVVLVVEE